MSSSVKLVVLGPYGVGKSTLVNSLSEINVLTTTSPVESAEGGGIEVDFGRMSVDSELQLYIFGIDIPEAIDPVWTVLGEGVIGVIVLVDDSVPESYDLAVPLIRHLEARQDMPFIVAVNRTAKNQQEKGLKRARHSLRLDETVHVTAVDASDEAAAKAVLVELFEATRQRLLATAATSPGP